MKKKTLIICFLLGGICLGMPILVLEAVNFSACTPMPISCTNQSLQSFYSAACGLSLIAMVIGPVLLLTTWIAIVRQEDLPTQKATPLVSIPAPQPKKSKRTRWIVLGLIGAFFVLVLFVGGAILSAWEQTQQNALARVNIELTVDASDQSPVQVAQGYYRLLSVADYDGAYTKLTTPFLTSDGDILTQAMFDQQAQALDASEGGVLKYTVTADPSDAPTVTVQVTRAKGKTYTIHLTFQQFGSFWLISSFDGI